MVWNIITFTKAFFVKLTFSRWTPEYSLSKSFSFKNCWLDCGAPFCFDLFIGRGLAEHHSSTPRSTTDYTHTRPISLSYEWNPHLPVSFGATGILTVPANISQVLQKQCLRCTAVKKVELVQASDCNVTKAAQQAIWVKATLRRAWLSKFFCIQVTSWKGTPPWSNYTQIKGSLYHSTLFG